MGFRIAYAAGFFSYMLFAWFAGKIFGLTGVDLWVVRGFLAIFGLSGAGLIYWWKAKKDKEREQAQAVGGGEPQGGGDEGEALVKEAEARLAASNVARGARIANVPVIFVTGAPGAAKTNLVVHSGLEPELLAGHVYQENAVVPTRAVNLWFARQTVFLEAGGKLLADPGRWVKLVKRVAPQRLASALGKGQQAPRAAVVCCDLEEFLKPGAADATAAAARNLRTRLGEISQHLGISFPVYVVFTKADRVAFFLDYVRNLSHEEATQVVGTTLPIEPQQAEGVYAERASQRLGAAFDNLFHSLCDKRIEYLSRESAGDKLPGIYEFPREFRKVRNTLVQFLVDVCRPSQLQAAPFLRGFYFSGVRPIVVDEVAAPSPAAARGFEQQQGPPGSATGIFGRSPSRAPDPVAAPRVAGTRRVPQWVFLAHFWNDIILGDRAAIDTSSASVKTSALRRILLASAAVLCLLYSVALLVSYVRNRGLESRVIEAASAIPSVPAGSQELPSLDSLKKLEALREQLALLTTYHREGAPLSLRWGLYTGEELYPEARRLYFGRFHSLLFGWTQASMIDTLRRLPPAPGPTDAYGPTYDTLKAYLITTAEWKRSTQQWLSPALTQRWSQNRNVDPERLQLAQKQFDFYSDELRLANPYSTDNEAQTVEHARRYLKQFNAEERIYQALIGEASRRNPSINFNRLYPNDAVTAPREVRGAFTREGWKFMEAAFRKPDTLFGGEEWVLGPQSFGNVDRAQLEQKLRAMYQRDFAEEWRAFLRDARVLSYANVPDAAKKLGTIASGQSPLLALFCLVAQNTVVENPEIVNSFRAPQQVVPPAPGCAAQFVGQPNQNYMDSLVRLQASVAQVATSPQGTADPAAAQTLSQADAALMVTKQMSFNFGNDKELPRTVQKLIEDPITNVQRALKGGDADALRAKGRVLCGQFNSLMSKYPFNLKNLNNQATIDEVNQFFRPQDGALWQFYAQSLQPLVQEQGPQYVPKAGGTISVTPQFLAFFNRAAAFSKAAYAAGAQQPRISYALKSDLTGTNQSTIVTLDGQSFTNTANKVATMKFVWPGNPPGARMQVKFGATALNWPSWDGPWGVFEFFGDAEERAQPTPTSYRLEWTLRGGGQSNRPVLNPETNQPVQVRFDLDMAGSPPIFRKGYFSGWACTAEVAR